MKCPHYKQCARRQVSTGSYSDQRRWKITTALGILDAHSFCKSGSTRIKILKSFQTDSRSHFFSVPYFLSVCMNCTPFLLPRLFSNLRYLYICLSVCLLRLCLYTSFSLLRLSIYFSQFLLSFTLLLLNSLWNDLLLKGMTFFTLLLINSSGKIVLI